MSLFGTSPEESATAIAKSRLSLFDDDSSPATGTKSSLFDDDTVSGASPWGMPTPKKAKKGELIRSLLTSSDVPDSYVDIFDNVLKTDSTDSGRIGPSAVSRVLSAANLGADDQARIMTTIMPGGDSLGRNEFNVLLALIGLAQEREDITLDGVDERRRNLPIPQLPSLSMVSTTLPVMAESAAAPPQVPASPTKSTPLAKPRQIRKDVLDEADPWGSPALHEGHNHIITPQTNGIPRPEANGIPQAVRTTSTFTTASLTDSVNGAGSTPPGSGSNPVDAWSSYGAESTASFAPTSDPGLGSEGFGDSGGGDDDRPSSNAPLRSFGGGRITTGSNDEIIQVTLLPEKEGMFMFQHHNYQVSSSRRGSKVVRRYSDFVWLLDCLQKRYPFRQLPLLPPKRVAVNGNHLATDSTFIEKRRRGLVRFANALVRHPVLNQEQLVVMFLTVPTELAVWRKQATISVQEEFVGKTLPAGLEDSLSPTLEDLFNTQRTGIRRSAEIYINLCNLLDRLAKRNEGLAADHLRISNSLQSLSDATKDTYATNTDEVALLNSGLHATAKHVSNSQSLLVDEAKAWDEGVLEDLKRQRDTLVSMREMFDRRDRYDKDNIPQLERRIHNNEEKLIALRAKPEGMLKPGEIEKVTDAIIKDKESIVAQHARGVFIKECIRDELIFFQQSQYHVSRWNLDWAQERVKYSELQADNWKQLHEELESMPLGD